MNPSARRHGPWFALPLAFLGAIVAARMHLSRSAEDVAPPPAEPAALHAWLAERAPRVDTPALGADAWPDLAGQPALSLWARMRLDPADLSPAVARGLAVHAVPVRFLRALGPRSGLDPEVLAVLLDPELMERVASACPRLDPGMRAALCGATARTIAARDEALAEVMLQGDDDLALWAAESASGLGDAGVRIGETVHRGAAEGPAGDRARGHALVVLARTLPPEDALRRLEQHARAEDPLAPLAIFEVSLLPGGERLLASLAGSIEEPGLAALASIAAERAAGQSRESGGGLFQRGL